MWVLLPTSQALPWEINILYTEQNLTCRPDLLRAPEMQRVRLWAWEAQRRDRLIPVKNRETRRRVGLLLPTPAASRLSKDAPENSHPHPDCACLPYRN